MSSQHGRRSEAAGELRRCSSGSVRTETIDGVPIVVVSGELDLALAAVATPELNAAIRGGARGVVIDLSAVEFIDSTGLVLLLGAYRRLDAADRQLAIACPNRSAHRLFRLTRLDHVLPLQDSRERALESVRPRPSG